MAQSSAVVEDFLDEDTEVPGQRYVLLSFLSPEKVLDKKELFFFKKFVESYELDWKVKNLEKFLMDTVKRVNNELDDKALELEKNEQHESAAICRKHHLSVDSMLTNYMQFVKVNQESLSKTSISESYDEFLFKQKTKLEEEFYALNNFHTSMRGVKVRGVFGNSKEAELKAKKLQTKDKYHNIFMGEVGKWTPWDPSPNEVKDQEYNNDQLNTLMKKYKENEDSRETFFEERTKNSKSGSTGSSLNASSAFGDMFASQGDLVLQRKVEKASITIEHVDESKEEASTASTASASSSASSSEAASSSECASVAASASSSAYASSSASSSALE